MNDKTKILDRIRAEKVIAILRLQEQKFVQSAVDALVAGGIQVLEITTNTPGFSEEIEKARRRHPDVLVGAGTVVTNDLAKKAMDGGAQFLVTPNTDREVAEQGNVNNIPVLMGAMTPTEVAHALDYGADIIKLFPAGNLGISYFKSLKGPFDTVPFFAVGGIDADTIQDWFEAGIDGVGLGSSLVKSNLRSDEDFKEVTALAEKFRKF